MGNGLSTVAQIFGAFAIVCSVIIYSRKDRSKILIFKCVQDICWFTHYMLLAVYPAAGSSLLCIGRSVVFYGNPKKEKRNNWLLPLFLVLYAISAAVTWKNIFSIIPATSSSISTVAFWLKNPKYTKALAILASLLTLSYNILVAHSLSVYIGVTFTVTTSVISILLQLRKEKKESLSK